MSKEQQHLVQHGQGNKQVLDSRTMVEIISDFLFRWRKLIFVLFGSVVVFVIIFGVYTNLRNQGRQATADLVYDLRSSFTDWKEAHPKDLLQASQSLKEQGEEGLELDEASQQKAAETEQDLTEQIQASVSSANKKLQAWGYWIEVQRAAHLEETQERQAALENLVALDDETFASLAKLHLAALFYAEDKVEEALVLWQDLADVINPASSQIIASIFLANYFARQGQKEEAVRYWQLVESVGEELLQDNDLIDENSFLGGDNNILAGGFRNDLKQWKAMAENQLLFLQSEKIKVAADSYDETVAVRTTPEEETPEETPEVAAVEDVSFGDNTGLPGLDIDALANPDAATETEPETEATETEPATPATE